MNEDEFEDEEELLDVIYEKLRLSDDNLNGEGLFAEIRKTHSDIYQGWQGCYDICSGILEALDNRQIIYNKDGNLEINDNKN